MIPCSRAELSSLAVTIHAARTIRGEEVPGAIHAEIAYCVGVAFAIIKEAGELLAEYDTKTGQHVAGE